MAARLWKHASPVSLCRTFINSFARVAGRIRACGRIWGTMVHKSLPGAPILPDLPAAVGTRLTGQVHIHLRHIAQVGDRPDRGGGVELRRAAVAEPLVAGDGIGHEAE